MRNIHCAFILIILMIPFSSHANDSSAKLAAGGLEFIKNPYVELRSEELYISPEKIRVRYVFFNKHKEAVKVLVAFPLPEIESPHMDKPPRTFPVDDSENPLGFSTFANGEKVNTSLHQSVYAHHKNYTRFLRQHGIPLSPVYSKTMDALKKLPDSQQKEFENRGLIWMDEFDNGDGIKKIPQPAWSLKTAYTWEQVFPPETVVIIEHEYQPVVGASVGTRIGAAYAVKEKAYQKFLNHYCIPVSLETELKALYQAGGPYYSEYEVAYILKTGANWAGSIADFTLTIDKLDKNNLVSFCLPGVQKISETRFQFRKKNFIPDKDLNILFLIPLS